MFAWDKFGQSLFIVLIYLLQGYVYVIMASAVLSWGFLPPTNKVMRILRTLTEPVLSPCRQILSRLLSYRWQRIDFSPILAIAFIQVLIFLLQWIGFKLFP